MYIERFLEKKIEKYLDSPEIIAIFGPRQVGKTTLLKELYKRSKNPIFLTFEDIELKALFEEDIKSFIKLYIEPYNTIYIDEFQYAKTGGKNLKFIYDTTEGKKIFISGSSAMELSINAVKYLAGRIFVFHLYSFSFGEFLNYKDKNLYELIKADSNPSPLIINKVNGYLNEYLIYGGYPRVILAESKDEKKEVLKNLLNIYLLRDIKDVAGIVDEVKMYKLLKALSLQIGNVVVYNELANLIGVSAIKLKEYLDILEKVFLIKKIVPFFTNKRLEIVKNPEIFFYDLGLRNAIINNFLPLENRSDGGAILENFVFRELIESDLKFYRTKNGAEVDFILNDAIPIEVKSNLSDLKIGKSFHYFLENYKPPKGYLLNLNKIGKKKIKEVEVKFLPLFMANKIAKEY